MENEEEKKRAKSENESETLIEGVRAEHYGKPTSSQLQKINTLARRALSPEEVFVFTAKMVGDALIDNRYVKIDKSLLRDFRRDALSGVALLLDHSWSGWSKLAIPYGRTFDAKLKKGNIEGEEWALYGDIYIVRGKEKDGISTDSIIADIEDGTLFDVSIGWGTKTYECSICGKSIQVCEHWPGQMYDDKLCYVIAKSPGFLMELSLVFDGAYPSASVLSSEYMETADIKASADLPLIHSYSARRGHLLTLTPRKEGEMPKEFRKDGDCMKDKDEVVLDKIEKTVVDSAKTEAPKKDEKEDLLTIAKVEVVEILGKEYDADAILSLAKEGIRYREELVQDTLEWGVRAMGNDFAIDAWRQLLSEPGRTIDAIKDFREQFKKQAEASIPTGRVTNPAIQEKEAPKGDEIPDEAFKA